MENPQSLSIESFSYSWLIPNPKDGICNTNDINHHLDKNFNFDIPMYKECPISLVHADDIFSNGYMMPTTFLSHSRTHHLSTSSAPTTPFYSLSTSSYHAKRQKNNMILMWKKSSSKIVQKCVGFFRPICKGLIVPRKSNKVDDLGRKVWEVQNWRASLKNPSMQSSPSSPCVNTNSYYDVDSDSIKEAILHCKRSFG